MQRFLILTALILAVFVFASIDANAEEANGRITANGVRVRSSPSMENDGNTLFSAEQNQHIDILGRSGDFFIIDIQGISNVYVHMDFATLTFAPGELVNSSTVMYDLPNGSQTAVLSDGDLIMITGVYRDWYETLAHGLRGFVPRQEVIVEMWDLLPILNQATARAAFGMGAISDSQLINDIINYSMRHIGTPYRYGGTRPGGFDCSGFVQYILGKHGINVARVGSGMTRSGFSVNRSQLLPGDLVFFRTIGRDPYSHVGLYIGNNEFIHSSTSRGVIISNLNETYYNTRFTTATRIF